MPLLIDDFTTGPYKNTFPAKSGVVAIHTTGTMLGGRRLINLHTDGTNPRSQPFHIDIGSANRLDVTVGSDSHVRIDVAYGYGRFPGDPPVPLGVDLHKYGCSFRTTFESFSGVSVISFKILVYTPNGQYFESSMPVAPSPNLLCADLDFRSFFRSVAPGQQPDFTNVEAIVYIIEGYGNLAIDSFEIV